MKATSSRREETEKAWNERLERFRKFQGSRSAFCRSEGITLSGLIYWLNKRACSELEPAPSRRHSAFAAVEIVSDNTAPSCSGNRLPDPRWTAEFLRHFLGASL